MKFSKRVQKQVDEHKVKKFEVGDLVVFNEYIKGARQKSTILSGEILKIKNSTATILPKYATNKPILKDISELTQSILNVGVNPIPNRRVYQKYSIDIRQLLSRMGYNQHGEVDDDKVGVVVDSVIQCNTDPVVLLKNGDYYHYQRDLVWDLDDKKKLIRSIYDGINIGSVVFRENSYHKVITNKDNPDYPVPASWCDLVDGKQRANAVLEFVQCKYKDHFGNYWDDLSIMARNRFMSTNNIIYIEMGEDTTDAEALEYFILLNDTGRPVDNGLLDNNKKILREL